MFLATESNLIRSICKENYYEFVKEFWDVVVPEKPVWNWHIKYICDEIQEVLERVFRGDKKSYDLVINVCPGSTKSTIASVMLLPWCWTRMPTLRSLNGSHTHSLVLEFSRKSRDIIHSEKYAACFPMIKLRKDQNMKGHFANSYGGGRLSCTVAGKSPLGFHAHVHVVDDPIDPKKALSDVEIESANVWMIETLSTRKVEKTVTPLILIMQRLAQNDPAGYQIEHRSKRIKHICIPAEVTDKIEPPELKKKYIDGLMDPVRVSHEVLEEEREKGDFFFCTPGFTPILMADWKEKEISKVKVGDEIVGYTLGGDGRRSSIVYSVVTDKSVSKRTVVKLTMESGREVYCTTDHKWWTRRRSDGRWPRPAYLPARIGKPLFSVYTPIPKPSNKEQRLWDWLGGMIDGDGGRSGNYITISQSPSANPVVFAFIEKTLTKLQIPFSIDRITREGGKFYGDREVQDRGESGTFILHGGRYTKMRLINNCAFAKKPVVLDSLWQESGFVAENKDNVAKIEEIGEMEVYGLTTTSGNYVAWGYASQNSGQFLQDPIPLGGGMFKTDSIQFADQAPDDVYFRHIVRCWDNAGSPKGKSYDRRRKYTVGAKMGLHKDGTYWILDIQRGRFPTHIREQLKKDIANADGEHVEVVQEQEGGSGGQESAENTVRTLAGYTVIVDNPKGDKTLRADPLSTQVNIGNVYMVKAPWNKDLVEELKHFPFSTYKDQVDALSAAFARLFKPRRKVGALFRGSPNGRQNASPRQIQRESQASAERALSRRRLDLVTAGR